MDGVWPDGLLDACLTMIPKSDGDVTPLGQRPLCVLPVVYRIWASVRLRHLDSWLRSWLPLSVFSAGGGRGSVDAWYSTSFYLRMSCLVLVSLMFMFLLLMWSSHLTLLIVVFWISCLGGWDFLFGSVGFQVQACLWSWFILDQGWG